MQKDEVTRMSKVTKDLKDQVTILKREVQTLGKRSAGVEPEEAAELDEAVVREIKRQRKDSHGRSASVSLDERRAADKAYAS